MFPYFYTQNKFFWDAKNDVTQEKEKEKCQFKGKLHINSIGHDNESSTARRELHCHSSYLCEKSGETRRERDNQMNTKLSGFHTEGEEMPWDTTICTYIQDAIYHKNM